MTEHTKNGNGWKRAQVIGGYIFGSFTLVGTALALWFTLFHVSTKSAFEDVAALKKDSQDRTPRIVALEVGQDHIKDGIGKLEARCTSIEEEIRRGRTDLVKKFDELIGAIGAARTGKPGP